VTDDEIRVGGYLESYRFEVNRLGPESIATWPEQVEMLRHEKAPEWVTLALEKERQWAATQDKIIGSLLMLAGAGGVVLLFVFAFYTHPSWPTNPIFLIPPIRGAFYLGREVAYKDSTAKPWRILCVAVAVAVVCAAWPILLPVSISLFSLGFFAGWKG
jgi:hypothetical protein